MMHVSNNTISGPVESDLYQGPTVPLTGWGDTCQMLHMKLQSVRLTSPGKIKEQQSGNVNKPMCITSTAPVEKNRQKADERHNTLDLTKTPEIEDARKPAGEMTLKALALEGWNRLMWNSLGKAHVQQLILKG